MKHFDIYDIWFRICNYCRVLLMFGFRTANNCDIQCKPIPKTLKLSHYGIGVVIGCRVCIGNYVKIMPKVTIAGYVIIEDNVTICTGALIYNKPSNKEPLVIGEGSIIGAGFYVYNSIPSYSKVTPRYELY